MYTPTSSLLDELGNSRFQLIVLYRLNINPLDREYTSTDCIRSQEERSTRLLDRQTHIQQGAAVPRNPLGNYSIEPYREAGQHTIALRGEQGPRKR